MAKVILATTLLTSIITPVSSASKRVTCYLPTGHRTASGHAFNPNICAANMYRFGDVIELTNTGEVLVVGDRSAKSAGHRIDRAVYKYRPGKYPDRSNVRLVSRGMGRNRYDAVRRGLQIRKNYLMKKGTR